MAGTCRSDNASDPVTLRHLQRRPPVRRRHTRRGRDPGAGGVEPRVRTARDSPSPITKSTRSRSALAVAASVVRTVVAGCASPRSKVESRKSEKRASPQRSQFGSRAPAIAPKRLRFSDCTSAIALQRSAARARLRRSPKRVLFSSERKQLGLRAEAASVKDERLGLRTLDLGPWTLDRAKRGQSELRSRLMRTPDHRASIATSPG